jgi:hypothetical protein
MLALMLHSVMCRTGREFRRRSGPLTVIKLIANEKYCHCKAVCMCVRVCA